MRLAKACGIDVAETRVVRIGSNNVFMVKRFDRKKTENSYSILHYVSALTLLGKDETESPMTGYGDIASVIMKHGPENNTATRQELFRRMVFNILISNIDDHLRNHGFVYEGGSYNLSKAYDLVPTPLASYERFQHLYVGTQGKLSNLDNALSQSGLYGFNEREAKDVVNNMTSIVSGWPMIFSRQGVSDKDIETLKTAFRTKEALMNL